jgi:hypothetical protein
VIRELAENANTYTPLGPGEERVVDERFVIWLGAGDAPWWTVVQRLRLRPAIVSETVAEVRELLATRGRTTCTWEVAESATPAGLADELLALGLVLEDDPHVIGMVLDRPPTAPVTSGIEARAVRTMDELADALRIAAEAFGMPEEQTREQLETVDRDFAREGVDGRTFLAFLDGRPVSRATATYTPHGVLLFGGATLAAARGHGAYRALVRARWDDAVARGTPLLVTHAGALSQPILRRLGFGEVSRLTILRDDFGSRS